MANRAPVARSTSRRCSVSVTFVALAGLEEAQLEELAFLLLLATGERAADFACAEAMQDTVRRALEARTSASCHDST